MTDKLTEREKQTLLRLAREALEAGVRGEALPALDDAELTPTLRANGATFITLTMKGQLRGCIGALQPYQSLAEDVRDHAVAAALQDYRFPTVKPDELPKIEIEISRLTSPQPLDYVNSHDLLAKLNPGVDGVILTDGIRRATFLPQVWANIPDKAQFLSQLCYKMGAASDLWRQKHLEVAIYHVEEFQEQTPPGADPA